MDIVCTGGGGVPTPYDSMDTRGVLFFLTQGLQRRRRSSTVHFGKEQLMWPVLKWPEGPDQPWHLFIIYSSNTTLASISIKKKIVPVEDLKITPKRYGIGETPPPPSYRQMTTDKLLFFRDGFPKGSFNFLNGFSLTSPKPPFPH